MGSGSGAEYVAVRQTKLARKPTNLTFEQPVDYNQNDFTDGGRSYGLIIDIAGNTPLSRLRRVLTPTGRSSSSGPKAPAS